MGVFYIFAFIYPDYFSMDKLLIKSATLIFPGADEDGQQVDMLIVAGKIAALGPIGSLKTDDDVIVIQAEGSVLAPGFFDLNANFGEPGLESKEDIVSGAAAAAAGGFTAVAVHPNTHPPIHSQTEVSLIVNRSNNLLVDVYPIGAISQNREGKDLAELYDMKLAGAIAFSDGNRSIQQSGLMSRALLYSKGFGGLVFAFSEDASVAGKAKMNEGRMSTYLGMKGNPNLAEELMVARDLYLAAYNEAPIHFSTISTAGSVDLIRSAKAKGLQVTCDVAAHHLLLTDEALIDFDSNYKVKPPLRSEVDRLALVEAVRDGSVDAIVSQHTPHEIEFKEVEFETAAFGITGLQTVLPILLMAGLSNREIVQALAIAPRKIVGLPIPVCQLDENANLVLYNPDEQWTFDRESNRSKAENNPFFKKELRGKVQLVINNGQVYYG
ncbi:dihydroorotase [bacterium A37T11]|nr:dihydroorotase [bacterium A37T11]